MNRTFTSELKSRTRRLLLGKWAFLAGVFLFQFLLNMILQELVSTAFPYAGFGITAEGSLAISFPYVISRIIVELFSTILSVGSMFLYLNICRRKAYRLNDLFFGFTHQPEHILGYFALLFLLAILCGAVPTIFLTLAILTRSVLWIALSIVSGLLFLAGYYRLFLSYVMFPYLYADSPWKTSRELLRESRRLMNGHKMRYFYLQLSFTGILLLGLLSFGIGTIWITPYITVTNTQYYLDLISETETGSNQAAGGFDAYGNPTGY